MLLGAGFVDVKIDVKENGRDIVAGWIPGSGAEKYVTSAYVTATKPRGTHGFRDAVVHDLKACAPPQASSAPKACAPTACAPPQASAPKACAPKAPEPAATAAAVQPAAAGC